MSNEILGATQYAVLIDESTWGTFPGSPVYNHCPVLQYGVKFKAINRQANPYIGTFQRKHSRNVRGMPSGALQSNLYGWRNGATSDPSLAQVLMDWAFINWENAALPSKSIEWAEGPNVANKRHLGLRVNSATLTGSDDAGVLELSLDLMGQDEVGNDVVAAAQTLPTNRDKLLEFEWPDVAVQLAGVTIPMKSIQLQVQHGLKVAYLSSRRPTLLLKSQRLLTFNCVPIKNSDVYDAYNRTSTATAGSVEMTGQIVAKGLHNGSGAAATNYAQVTVAFPRLTFLNGDTAGAKEDLLTQPLTFVALKPDTSGNDASFTWADVA